MRPSALAVLSACLLSCPLGVSAAWGADVEQTLNARWRGGFVVVKLPIASSCNDLYNDNDVVGNRSDSSAGHRFAKGELAHVERIGVKRSRVDVFLDIAEEVLDEVHDGPFTLYEPRQCKIQLKVPVETKDAATVETRLAQLLELHANGREAETSPAWNRRRRPPFPKGYDRTLAEHAAWKAAQINTAVQARLDDAIEEAARIADHVRSDPDYLSGFSDGLKRGLDRSFGDCDSLLRETFSPYSSGGGKGSEGRRDGERLGYTLELLRHLKECFVPVPAPPG